MEIRAAAIGGQVCVCLRFQRVGESWLGFDRLGFLGLVVRFRVSMG